VSVKCLGPMLPLSKIRGDSSIISLKWPTFFSQQVQVKGKADVIEER